MVFIKGKEELVIDKFKVLIIFEIIIGKSL